MLNNAHSLEKELPILLALKGNEEFWEIRGDRTPGFISRGRPGRENIPTDLRSILFQATYRWSTTCEAIGPIGSTREPKGRRIPRHVPRSRTIIPMARAFFRPPRDIVANNDSTNGNRRHSNDPRLNELLSHIYLLFSKFRRRQLSADRVI